VQTEDTRKLIHAYYEALPSGDRARLASLLAEDVEWTPPETAPIEPIKGRDAVAQALGGDLPAQIFDMKTFRLDIHRILADGDIAIVQHSISAKTVGGAQYDNEYCWVYHCRDGVIAKIEEYADTLKASRVMGWEG
jgi:ketosteroid isomerase-like protein